VNRSPETTMKVSRIMAILWKNSNGLEGPLSLCQTDGSEVAVALYTGNKFKLIYAFSSEWAYLSSKVFP
jgi:hypothetical protein